jgi:hypothetical protein
MLTIQYITVVIQAEKSLNPPPLFRGAVKERESYLLLRSVRKELNLQVRF